jgi:isocitrate dehydrogenase
MVLAKALDRANGKLLDGNKTPSRKAGELDNRGSHFYLAMYWAQALAEQNEDKELQAKFRGVAQQLSANEAKIVEELRQAEGRPVDIGGYYHPSPAMASKAMRPSATFNAILDSIKP